MATEIPRLTPTEALAFFRRKGLRIGFAWQDVWEREHVRAFTVAKAMSRDLLEDIRAAVDAAIADGTTLAQFRERLQPLLQAKGWWGRANMLDPLDGQFKNVQLGSPRRLRTIFNVNLRKAYQAGRWERMERTRDAFPFVRYVSAEDSRVRPQHQAWHGTIKPIGDPWWEEHYPPCGWNCRCTAVPVNQRIMDRRGWEVTDRPQAFLPEPYVNPRTGEIRDYEAGISPGFGYNVGRAYLDDLAAHPIPTGRRAAGEAAQLGEAERARAFLAPFGLSAADRQGAVFVDDVGHPLAITPAMARDAAGFSAAELTAAGRAIAEPDEIRQLWSADAAGNQLLTRAYIAGDVAVLVNKAGWRVVPAAGRTGELLGREAAEAWIAAAGAPGVQHRPGFRLGPVEIRAARQLGALGHATAGREVALDHSTTVKLLRAHAADRPPQLPITAADIALVRVILNRGEISRGTPAIGPDGAPRIFVRAVIGGLEYEAAFSVRRATIIPWSLRKRPFGS